MAGIWNRENTAALIPPIQQRQVVTIADGFVIATVHDPRLNSAAGIIFKLLEPIHHGLDPGYREGFGLKRISSQKPHKRFWHVAAQVTGPGSDPLLYQRKVPLQR